MKTKLHVMKIALQSAVHDPLSCLSCTQRCMRVKVSPRNKGQGGRVDLDVNTVRIFAIQALVKVLQHAAFWPLDMAR